MSLTAQTAARKARLAVFAVFFINGFAGASWFVRIPAIRHTLDLSTGQLGFVLLGLPAGALIAMPVAGIFSARFGSRRINWIASVADCVAIALIGLAPDIWLLTGALVLFGAANGAMDVTMNAQGVAVERQYRRSIMAAFHGMFSISSMLGAAIGGLVASAGISPRVHLVATGLVLVGPALLAPLLMLPQQADARAGPGMLSPRRMRVPRPVLLLGAIGFCGLLAEGAMADWSAIFLRDVLATSAGIAAAGYAVFSLAMAAGRFKGDQFTDRFGAVRMVRYGSLLAATGLLIVTLTPWWPVTLFGFGLVGIGLSSIVPILFSAAGNTSGLEAGQAIATLTTISYFGFLTGPPMIGLLAGIVTLRGSFLFVTGCILAITFLASAVHHAAITTTPRVNESPPQ